MPSPLPPHPVFPLARAADESRSVTQLKQASGAWGLAPFPRPKRLGLKPAVRMCMSSGACVAHMVFGAQVFYASGMSASVPAASRVSTSSIQQLFNRYADPTDGVILADGVGRFCDDLGVRAPRLPVIHPRCADIYGVASCRDLATRRMAVSFKCLVN